jgi:hypothetical protein
MTCRMSHNTSFTRCGTFVVGCYSEGQTNVVVGPGTKPGPGCDRSSFCAANSLSKLHGLNSCTFLPGLGEVLKNVGRV